jgi:integrase/recombinase XerD
VEKIAQSLGELAEAFWLSKQVSGCTGATLDAYRHWLLLFRQEVGEAAHAVSVRRFFAKLQERGLSHSSVHQAYRSLKTFLRWAVAIGAIASNPLLGFSIRTPKTLPQVPTEEDVRAVVQRCSDTLIGRRNRALILVLADSGLRASEVLHLLVEDWNPQERGLFVRSGKGRKDRVSFLSPTTARAIKDYLGKRLGMSREDFLFIGARNRPLKRRHLVQILHRLSQKAGLTPQRRIHPHALRHFAATSWLRNGVGLDEVRRLLGRESLSTTLRYSSLVSSDLQAAHKRAGAIERMRLG